MTAGRVDQITAVGALRNHEQRIGALERVPPDSGSCAPYAPWSDYGATTLGITVTSTDGCAVVDDPPDATITGLVWSCDQSDVTLAASLIVGSLEIAMTGDPGDVDTGACDPDADIFYHYGFVPPFWQVAERIGPPVVVFGYGITYQAATGTALPAYLDYRDNEWAILVPGTDALTLYRGANLARPPAGFVDGYPWTYTTGDILFRGSFQYFVQFGD